MTSVWYVNRTLPGHSADLSFPHTKVTSFGSQCYDTNLWALVLSKALASPNRTGAKTLTEGSLYFLFRKATPQALPSSWQRSIPFGKF